MEWAAGGGGPRQLDLPATRRLPCPVRGIQNVRAVTPGRHHRRWKGGRDFEVRPKALRFVPMDIQVGGSFAGAGGVRCMGLGRIRTTSGALRAGAVPRRRPRGASSARRNRGGNIRLNPKRATNFPVSSKRGAVKANLSGGKAQLVAKTPDLDRRSRASVRGVVAALECWEETGNLRQGRRAHCYPVRFAPTTVTRRAGGGLLRRGARIYCNAC